jgi:type III secretion system YscI/HrpB-like protein
MLPPTIFSLGWKLLGHARESVGGETMSLLTAAVLDPVVTRGTTLADATRTVQVAQERTSAFDAALGRHAENAQGQVPNAAPGTPAAQPAPPEAPANERTRRALELGGPASTPSAGDMILNGLQRLRGVFDARHEQVAKVMASKDLDASTLLSMQVEVVNYTLLVDVTSKLTGKSTQSFDTLMKGQ